MCGIIGVFCDKKYPFCPISADIIWKIHPDILANKSTCTYNYKYENKQTNTHRYINKQTYSPTNKHIQIQHETNKHICVYTNNQAHIYIHNKRTRKHIYTHTPRNKKQTSTLYKKTSIEKNKLFFCVAE